MINLNLSFVSPSAGRNNDGVLRGRINPSQFIASFLASKIIPVMQVLREDISTNGTTLVDVTTAATDSTANDFAPFNTTVTMSDGDSFYFRTQNDADVQSFFVQVATQGVGTWSIDVQEWNTTTEAWESVAGLVDGSNGFRNALGVYRISYSSGAEGKVRLTANQSTKFLWHRVVLKNPTVITTAPILSRIWVLGKVFNFTDISSATNSSNWVVLPTEILPVVNDFYCIFVHPGPPIGMDANVVQAESANFTTTKQYLASDNSWKSIPDLVDPSNMFHTLGNAKIRWSRPSDWTSMTQTINGVAYTGYFERCIVTAIAVQGAVAPARISASSRALGEGNAIGIVLTAQTLNYATFTIGSNNATVGTVFSLMNAESGKTSTMTIPITVDESADVSTGKITLSTPLVFAEGESLIVICSSGGALVACEMRLQ